VTATKYRELRSYCVDVAFALFQDDTAAGLIERLPPLPSLVTAVTPSTYAEAPDRVEQVVLTGSFSTIQVMAMDWNGGTFKDRYDVIECYLTPMNLPEHLGAQLSMQGQPGANVTELTLRPDTVQNRPGATAAPPPAEVPPAPTPTPTTAPKAVPKPAEPVTVSDPTAITNESGPLQPVIGSTEPVPELALGRYLDPQLAHEVEVFRTFPNVDEILSFEPADRDMMHFGLPPNYVPIISFRVGGMTIGLMIDAPEHDFADAYACKYEFSSDGVTLTDAHIGLGHVLWSSLTERRLWIENDDDGQGLTHWQQRSAEYRELIGYTHESSRGLPDFAWKDKRRKPRRSPEGTKWRTDSGGNGVLADVPMWGTGSIRRPRSIAAALKAARSLPPAAALHGLYEGLAIANRTHNAPAALEVYGAMIYPLNELGRGQIASRAAALAELGS